MRRALLLSVMLLGCSRAPGKNVPTHTVHREPFAREVTAEGYLRAVKSTPLSLPRGSGPQKLAWMVRDGSPVKKGDVVFRFDPTDSEKKLRDSQADLASAQAKIQKESVLVGAAVRGRERTADLSSAELAQTKAFANKDTEIFSRNQIIESEIDEGLSSARLEHATATKTIESSLSGSRVALLGVEKQKADLKIAQATRGLANLEVHAPHDGIVVLEADWHGNLPHVGDSVWPGQTLASLPLLDEMECDVFVLEADAAGLAVDNPATVTLEAHPDPTVKGKITRIDSLAKPRQRDVPIQYFGATLSLETTDPARMKPGARVHAVLALGTREALTVPRQAVFEREGKTVVYRAAGNRFDQVTVKLGASTPGRVVIEEGLADGDKVATEEPR